jgi:iron complex transport system substrate-binding protein
MHYVRFKRSCALFVTFFALVAAAAGVPPKRIVSLSPNTTEILYGVGAFDQVVGVSAYCLYPPAAMKLPRVGGWENSDIEKIVALRPDLVVLTDAQVPFIADKLEALGLHSLAVPSRNLADVFTAISSIGAATGHEQQAAELSLHVRSGLEDVRRRTKPFPQRTVLLSVSRTPGTLQDLYVATEGSYLVDLIDIAGGRSVAAPAKTGYGKINKEAILSLNPDLIIDLVHGSKGTFAEHPEEVWNDLPELRAVRENHIHPVDDDFIPHASQFVVETAKVFARIIHPEAFTEAKK